MQKDYKNGKYDLAIISYNTIKNNYYDTSIYNKATELYNEIDFIIKEQEDRERIEKEEQEKEKLEQERKKEEARLAEQKAKEKERQEATIALANKTVYIANAKSRIFHEINCRTFKTYLDKMTRKQALEKGYEPCKVCRP